MKALTITPGTARRLAQRRVRIIAEEYANFIAREEDKRKHAIRQNKILALVADRLPLPATTGIVMKTLVPLRTEDETTKAASLFVPKSVRDMNDDLGILPEVPCAATEPVQARVFELRNEATFREMRKQLRANPRNLAMTEGQILAFVKEHRNWLIHECGYVATYFFVKLDREFVVIDIVFHEDDGGKLDIFAFEFTSRKVWSPKFTGLPGLRRLVVLAPPQKRKVNL